MQTTKIVSVDMLATTVLPGLIACSDATMGEKGSVAVDLRVSF